MAYDEKMQYSKKCAGLILGDMPHHLDHIAPLCRLLNIPLFATEAAIAKDARLFYPGIEVIEVEYLHASEFLVSHFDIIFYSMPRDLFDEVFFFAQKLLQKKIHTVWCPHGNSDKGHNVFFMEALRKEEIALVYGKQMIDFLKKKKAFDQLKQYVLVGNYRYEFYKSQKNYYDNLIEREILRKLPPSKRCILYAPTWKDYELSSSFVDAMPHLASKIPPDINLIVKLHPNLLKQNDLIIDEIIDRYRSHPHILFITDFPPIYPLLNIADVYLGDMSSIGYDYLAFDRPMFFLNQNARDSQLDPGLYLFRCGIEIKKENYPEIYQKIDNFFNFELRSFSQIRKDVYNYAFGQPKSLEAIKKEISEALSIFSESDLNFF